MSSAFQMPFLPISSTLKPATLDAVPALRRLEQSMGSGQADIDWASIVRGDDARVMIAFAGEELVGAAAVRQSGDAAVATLAWLGVKRLARGRGIGGLLLRTTLSQSHSAGAAVVRVDPRPASSGLEDLLRSFAFGRTRTSDGMVYWEKSLWTLDDKRVVGTLDPRLYGGGFDNSSGPAQLVLPLVSVDSRFLLSPRSSTIADAAAARGFNVAVHNRRAHGIPVRPSEFGRGKVDHVAEMPTPEELAGLLWRRHVVVIKAAFPRLADGRDLWLILTGFDGLLFQVFDPERPQDRTRAVSIAEMRTAFQQETATCLVISRNSSR